jgi:5'-nucleotidase (lipoprotein e(P4) family)
MKKLFILIITLGLFTYSCEKEDKPREKIDKYVVKKAGDHVSESEHLSMATVWFQKSAENRAIYYQTYKFAKNQLEANIKDKSSDKPLAVITDIDETVLDNSPYNAGLIYKSSSFTSDSWEEWVKEIRAKALPGALDFCKYAESKNVEVFYISNRNDITKAETIENLKNAGFPYVDEEHVLLKKESSDKTERRKTVLDTHEVVLYLGDNLRDFDEIFGNRVDDLGFDIVDELSDKFGTLFIVFPNPIYGEWEKAVYKGDFSLSEEEKRKRRLEVLDK